MKKEKFLLLLCLTQLLFSCNTSFDIVKRRYNTGYYVDISNISSSNKKYTEISISDKKRNPLGNIDEEKECLLLASNDNEELLIVEKEKVKTTFSLINIVEKKKTTNTKRHIADNKTIRRNVAYPDDNTPQPTIEKFGILSIILSAVGFTMLFFFFTPPGLVGFILLVAGLISGIISLLRIGAHPAKYKGRGFAITGIVLSSLFILMYLLGIFYFIEYEFGIF